MKIFHVFNVHNTNGLLAGFCEILIRDDRSDYSNAVVLYGDPTASDKEFLAKEIVDSHEDIVVAQPNMWSFAKVLRAIVKHDGRLVFHGMHWKWIFFVLATFPTMYLRRMGYVCCGEYVSKHKSRKTLSRLIRERFMRYVLSSFCWVNTLSPADRAFMATLLNQDSNIYNVNYPGFRFETAAKSNISRGGRSIDIDRMKVTIQICHRNDPSFRHKDIFRVIAPLSKSNIEVLCPLSYGGGTDDYIESVIKRGRSTFDEKFNEVVRYMEKDKYTQLLDTVDITIMNNPYESQNGLFIILHAASAGQKLYLRQGDPNRLVLPEGVIVYDYETMEDDIKKGTFASFASEISLSNSRIMLSVFGWLRMKDNFDQLMRKLDPNRREA